VESPVTPPDQVITMRHALPVPTIEESTERHFGALMQQVTKRLLTDRQAPLDTTINVVTRQHPVSRSHVARLISAAYDLFIEIEAAHQRQRQRSQAARTQQTEPR